MTRTRQPKLPKGKLTQKEKDKAEKTWKEGKLLADEIDLKSATKEHLLYSIKLQERFLQDYEMGRKFNQAHILDLRRTNREMDRDIEAFRQGMFRKNEKLKEENKELNRSFELELEENQDLKAQIKRLKEGLN